MSATKQTDEFTQAYIECAIWASSDDNGKPLDQTDAELADETIAAMVRDCETFQSDHADLLAQWYDVGRESEERAGHDFWLTRNGHGAGFWDRWASGTPQGEIGRRLTDAAKAYGTCDLYVGDDGRIYVR